MAKLQVHLPNSLLEAFDDDDLEYKLFPGYQLFEYKKVSRTLKMAPAAIYKLSGIDSSFNFKSFYYNGSIAPNPCISKKNTLQINVNMQKVVSGEENNEGKLVNLPDEIIIPSKLLGYDKWYVYKIPHYT